MAKNNHSKIEICLSKQPAREISFVFCHKGNSTCNDTNIIVKLEYLIRFGLNVKYKIPESGTKLCYASSHNTYVHRFMQ